MTTLDSTTGLPELPENFRWYVQNSRDRKGLYIELQHYSSEKKEYKPIADGRTWLGRQKFKYGWVEVPLPPNDPSGWSRVRNFSAFFSEPTHEAMLAAATKVLEAWETSLARDELVGAYPPKSIR